METDEIKNVTSQFAGRVLVVMCDGTGNEVAGDLSNVMKMYRACVRDDNQRVFYSPGVGTIENNRSWRRLRQHLMSAFGLATGYGLDDDILEGYRFLCLNYRPGDRIMLFGFSRGAYAVRALGGLLNAVGLLSPDQHNLAGQAISVYKQCAEDGDLRGGWDFGRVLGTQRVVIDFLGLWDTVASVIIPRPD
ncbi:putative alpha/beta hydrolase family protein DUF2235 [Rhizobium sp. PP-F2F-G38]|nr:putative alpha/beta hydrolase family protein DUF2235 [Rhizobium sp. PP-F2F-G38]